MTNKQTAYSQLHTNSAKLQAAVLKLSNHLDRMRAVQVGSAKLAASLSYSLKSAVVTENTLSE
jgi:hypothetical protein